jgi:hypothetical protein
MTVSGCTLTGNSTEDVGGGIFNDEMPHGGANLTITSCTITGNSAGTLPQGGGREGGGIYNDRYCTLILKHSDV